MPSKQEILDSLDAFTKGYLECALWTADNEDGDSLLNAGKTFADFSDESLQKAKAICEKFEIDNEPSLCSYYDAGLSADYAGHDAWLDRNRHGSGAWDRGLGAIGDRLTAAAQALGEQDVVVGDDGELHLEGGL